MKSKCPSCGVSWTKHLGATGLCEELQICRLLLSSAIDLCKVYRKKVKKYEMSMWRITQED